MKSGAASRININAWLLPKVESDVYLAAHEKSFCSLLSSQSTGAWLDRCLRDSHLRLVVAGVVDFESWLPLPLDEVVFFNLQSSLIDGDLSVGQSDGSESLPTLNLATSSFSHIAKTMPAPLPPQSSPIPKGRKTSLQPHPIHLPRFINILQSNYLTYRSRIELSSTREVQASSARGIPCNSFGRDIPLIS